MKERHLEGRELILASMQFSKENRAESWKQLIITLIAFFISGALTFIPTYIPIRILFSVLFALMMVRTFILYHDYQHGAIFQKSKLAKLIMTWYGLFILAPVNIWKRTHDHHHHNNSKLSNSGIGSFPLVERKDYEKLKPKQKFMYLLSRHPLTILFGYITLFILDLNIKSLFRSPKNHWDSFLALLMHAVMGYLVYAFFGLEGLLFSFIIPFMLAFATGAYLFFAQHNFPSASFKDTLNWDYSGAALESTSYLKMGPVMNWFTGNIGYHHVHHVNHRIPFYRLKEAMDKMPELQNPRTTTLHPKDIYACLRLKVWDAEKEKLTPL